MGSTRGTTKSRGNKNTLDKFYTREEVVDQCLESLDRNYGIVIEPSAGGGAFSSKFSQYFPNSQHYAFDLLPENENIEQADWLQLDKRKFAPHSSSIASPTPTQGLFSFNNQKNTTENNNQQKDSTPEITEQETEQGKKILVVGNPPFGNQGSLAMKFIHASVFADTIAFILPKGFMKDSIKNRIPSNFHLADEKELSPSSFTLLGEKYSVPCVWQVWEKQPHSRKITKTPKISSQFFMFTKQDKADFRVQRVGGNAGKASVGTDVSPASNYFLSVREESILSEMDIQEITEEINTLSFPTINHTTGPRSLPKGELVNVIDLHFHNLLNLS